MVKRAGGGNIKDEVSVVTIVVNCFFVKSKNKQGGGVVSTVIMQRDIKTVKSLSGYYRINIGKSLRRLFVNNCTFSS